ncbi:MAG: hypothetical protein F6J93_00175 [Oscillatoria sp. SIO1A7]|nr:hypothetical protein [Oscillatoria sp. SIO1A7]
MPNLKKHTLESGQYGGSGLELHGFIASGIALASGTDWKFCDRDYHG